MARIDGYDFPDDLWYDSREHLWLRPAQDGETWLVTVGIDAVGQDALGEVVYIMPTVKAGQSVVRAEALGSVEAEKMVRPVRAPISGTLREVNRTLLATPRLLNRDPYGEGWLCRIQAASWEAERAELLHGEEAVTAWIRAELEAYKERR